MNNRCVWSVLGILFITSLTLLPSAAAAPPAATGPALIAQAVRQDTSPPLATLAKTFTMRAPDREIPIRVPNLAARYKGFEKRPDPLLQSTPALTLTPQPIASFEGLSDDDNAAVIGGRVVPPDTNGDVGTNHYVQFINLILAVYDKNTGARIFGPVAGNAIWNGFGGICESNNDGDPVVVYDHLAGRWVVSQFAIGSDGHQCVAVSLSGDPTGQYFRYDFAVSPAGAFNDYPKLGVWADAYYMSANEFASSFNGAIAVAFEREKMLVGDPTARMIKFGPLGCGTECFYSLLPSDLDGPAPPPGTPNTFVMSFDDETWGTGANPDGYRLWNFHVDWATPAASSFTSLPQVNTAEFDANMCNFNIACVPQPKGGERLDSLSQFTMYRAQYRFNADGSSSMVVNHTVDATGRNLAGIRWAELRNAGGGWSLARTGTIAPGDGNHRWLGSLALDKAGDLALGYSVSSRSVFPSIRYATIDSPTGTSFGPEVELVAGTGSQRASYNRWGDYSTMSVDPVDGCTFWYTQEYYANTGSFDFKTRIGSFKSPNCTP